MHEDVLLGERLYLKRWFDAIEEAGIEKYKTERKTEQAIWARLAFLGMTEWPHRQGCPLVRIESLAARGAELMMLHVKTQMIRHSTSKGSLSEVHQYWCHYGSSILEQGTKAGLQTLSKSADPWLGYGRATRQERYICI
jgi:hypothetical protein